MRRMACVVALTLIVAPLTSAHTAHADEAWASVITASIHPGVQTVTGGNQCTTNFVFADGQDVFIGQAAHCAGTGGSTSTNGCDAATLPTGTKVEIEGATRPGTIVYSSWVTMQRLRESREDVCLANDFALVKLHSADRSRINPSLPFWGGPTGLGTETSLGERVFTYGRSGLRGGIDALSPLQGVVTAQEAGGWSHNLYLVPPGVPGDSGSGLVGGDGRAIGVLSTIEALPRVGSNNASDLSRALRYMHEHTDLDGVRLVVGTEPFDPNRLV